MREKRPVIDNHNAHFRFSSAGTEKMRRDYRLRVDLSFLLFF